MSQTQKGSCLVELSFCAQLNWRSESVWWFHLPFFPTRYRAVPRVICLPRQW